MFDLLLNLGSFMLGMSIGKAHVVENNNKYNPFIDDLYEKERLYEAKWLDAEQRAESWERRYKNLLSNTQSTFEE